MMELSSSSLGKRVLNDMKTNATWSKTRRDAFPWKSSGPVGNGERRQVPAVGD